MNLGPQAQAVMLLTVPFGKYREPDPKPLSTKEWARFSVWLKDHDLEPSHFLKGDLKSLISGWTDRSITPVRLEGLLDRGVALGMALEKWQRAGLWVLTRSDPEYPERLKRRLRLESPPVLFGYGNKMLLGRGGIAVVGSRDANQDDIAFTEHLSSAAARQGYSLVSGGARGVDQSAMLGALQNEGTVIGVMADSLLRVATSAKYRKYLLSDDLALITPFNPEAGFNAGNAMLRNRYIYCLADAAVVVSSTPNKGGTWNGALEDLKSAWVPLWVKRSESTKSGNSHLVQKGAHWLPDDLNSIACLLDGPLARTPKDKTPELPPLAGEAEDPAMAGPDTEATAPSELESKSVETQPQTTGAGENASQSTSDQVAVDFYTLFLMRMLDITGERPLKIEEITLSLELEKPQLKTWLKRGVNEGKIKKLLRPLRFQSSDKVREQASLFGNHR